MIKIDEQFSIQSYAYGWELHTKTISEDTKKGYTINITYYSNLVSLCHAIIDKSAKKCDSIEEMLNEVKRVKKDFKSLMQELVETK